jgi:uncharacterized protein YecE (DUF72 family)
MLYRFPEHEVAMDLVDLDSMPKLDRVTNDFACIRLFRNRSAILDESSRSHLNRKPNLTLWARRVFEYLECVLTVFVAANNQFQGRSPTTARPPLTKMTGVDPRL